MLDGLALPHDARGDLPNCGLTAMAVAARCTLAEATEAYQQAMTIHTGRTMRGNWKGRTFRNVRHTALTQVLGLKVRCHLLPPMTLSAFMERHAVYGRRYIVTTTGHVQVVGDGLVTDQRGTCHIKQFGGRRKRVREVLEILED